MEELRWTLHSRDVDIFACSESWLGEKHDDNIVSISGFRVFREDRKERIGGGVAVWVKDSIAVNRHICSHPPELECLTLHFSSFGFWLVTLYIPPEISLRKTFVNSFIIDHVDSIQNVMPNAEIIVCGDLNRLNPDDIKNSLNLLDLHKKPTYGDAQLDYVLASYTIADYYKVTDFPPLDISKVPHISLLATPTKKIRNQTSIPKTVYDLRASRIDDFVTELRNIEWSFLDDDGSTLDEKTELFHKKLKDVFMRCIPQARVTCTNKDKPWITNVIKDMINKRWDAYRKRNFQLFNHLKLKIRTEIFKSKTLWMKRTKGKELWKAVHQTIGTKMINPVMAIISQYKSLGEAVEAINCSLSSVFLPSNLSLPSSPHIDIDWQIDVSPMKVMDMLRKVSKNKATSDIPALLYKRAASLLASPLSKLFSQSIKTSKVPKLWKKSSICPIPKTKTPSINDIRPISILPLPVKLLEKIVVKSLQSKFLQHFGDNQFGYRPRSSTLCALISLHESVTKFLDNENSSGAMIVTYDYSKAFDRLRSDHILNALHKCAFPASFSSWIHDYLSDRMQYVRIGDICSREVPVTSGVPQGSVLGPYLFALATGSFSCHNIDCHLIRYADDTSYSFPIFKSSPNDHVLREHDRLLQWSKSLDLKVNPQKCKSIIIRKTMNCDDIYLPGVEKVEKVTILGVTFNTHGNWTTHIDNVVRMASRRFYALRLLRPSLSNNELVVVYNAFLRSILEYCAPLFLGMSSVNANRLNLLQKRFHRLLCGRLSHHCCLEGLEDRRRNLSLRLLQKMRDESHILHCELPKISSTGRYILPTRRTTRRCRSFIPLACELSNNSFKR